jgi:hypothetical protein
MSQLTFDGTQGLTFPDGTQIQSANSLGMRNRIINGAMVIAQRGTSATWSAGNTFCVDRFRTGSNVGWGSGVISATQSTNAPTGFTNSLGLTVSTADTLGGSNSYILVQPIEANNIADLGQGASWAKSFTLSFWVYSSLTGTFSGQLESNGSTSRSWFFTYSIPVANTWTYVTTTVTGDTGGTANWLTGTSVGMYVRWSLGCSSAYCTGTTGSWINNSTGYDGVTGQVNLIATSGATFYITGVQLEKGLSATPFEYRHYGTELALCQRYYASITGGVQTIYQDAYALSSNYIVAAFTNPVQMRTSPTAAVVGTFYGYNLTASTPDAFFAGTQTTTLQWTVSATGRAVAYNNANSGYSLSAEL